MELEYTLPHNQVYVTCPYPENGRFSPQTHTPFPNDPSYYYHSFYACVSEVFFSLSFPTQTLFRFLLSPIHATFPGHLVHFDFVNRQMLG